MATAQQLQFGINFMDSSVTGNVLSPTEFKKMFLWGIPLCNPVTGETLSDDTLKFNIAAAQKSLEGILDIKLLKQYIEEQKDFNREEFGAAWGYITFSWLINKVYSMTGQLNQRQIIFYPSEWLTIYRKTPSDYVYSRNFYIVPNGNSGLVTFDYMATINNQWFSYFGARFIPFYWDIAYLTGFNVIPEDLINLIGMMAAIQILPLIELVVATGGGMSPFGAASQSLGLDGLSQSVSKVNGGNIFKSRTDQYKQLIDQKMIQLKNTYAGISFLTC